MDLPPPTIDKDIPVTPMRVAGSHPYRVGARRLFPPTLLPVICVSFIAVVSTDPYVLATRTRRTMFMDADRRPKLYYDLRMGGYHPNCKAKQRCEYHFSHFLLLLLYEQMHSRSRRSGVNTLLRVNSKIISQIRGNGVIPLR